MAFTINDDIVSCISMGRKERVSKKKHSAKGWVSSKRHPHSHIHQQVSTLDCASHTPFAISVSGWRLPLSDLQEQRDADDRFFSLPSLFISWLLSVFLHFTWGPFYEARLQEKFPFPVKIFAILKFCSIIFILFNSGFRVLINNAFHHVKCSHMQPKEWNQSRMQVRLKWCYWVEISKGKGRRMVPVHDWLH